MTACAASTDESPDARRGGPAGDGAGDGGLDLDRPWTLHPQVAVRPEPFGALLYHFDSRRLSFLKDPVLLGVVERLGARDTARMACLDAGVRDHELARYARALATLARSDIVIERRT